MHLTELQWDVLAIEVEGFQPDLEWPCRYSGGRVSEMLLERLGLQASPQIINRWRRTQPEYRMGFFRLLDQGYWPSLKRGLPKFKPQRYGMVRVRGNKNPKV